MGTKVGRRGRRGRRGSARAATRWGRPTAVLPWLALVVLLTGCAGAGGSTALPADSGAPADATGRSATPIAGAQDDGPGGLDGLASLLAQASGSPGASPSAASASASASAAAGSPSPGAAAAGGRTVAAGDLLMFATPSRNIGCAFSPEEVRCDIAKHTWAAPEPPASCELDYGNGLFLADGPAGFTCAGDTVLAAPDAVVVGYDQKVTGGDLECVVNKAGITCRNVATGHGFTLSREAHTEF